MPDIDDIVRDEVTSKLSPSYKQGQPTNLGAKENLDPFGLLNDVPGQKLGAYDFTKLKPNQAGSFLDSMDLRKGNNVPGVKDIAPSKLGEVDTNVHREIPRLQHSIWVGQPLNGDSAKKKAFMEQLVKNKQQNPGWEVVLWTDQPRERFNKKPLDQDIVEMEKWARENGIKLVSIDEVFGDTANRMELHNERRLEQNKSGTGRAVVSDLTRLEILNRFGGVYVDGDKPFKKSLDQIVDQAADAQIQIRGQGKPVSGFVSAREGNVPQNCALCSQKDSPVTKAIISHIGQEYTKNREQMKQKTGTPMTLIGRPQRMEVIARSGPTAIEAITKGKGLMDKSSLQSYTGTTSWSMEEPYAGYKVPTKPSDLSVTGLASMSSKTEVDSLKASGLTLPTVPSTDGLTKDRQEAIGKAVRGGLTALSYTTANEMGRLDLKHLEPHFNDLSEDEKKIALQATLKALDTPAFKGMRDSVTSFGLSTKIPVTKESMDLLTNKDKFANLKLDDYCLQRAALRGDVAVLQYAKDKGISLTQKSQMMDTGTRVPAFFSGKYTPLMSAVHGNQVDAVKFLMANSHLDGTGKDVFNAAELKDQMDALKLAGERGQTEAVAVITEIAAHKIGLITDDLERQKQMEALSEGLVEAVHGLNNEEEYVKRFPKTPAHDGLETLGGIDLPGLDDLKNDRGALEGLDDTALRKKLSEAGLADTEISSLAALGAGNLKTGMKQALNQGALDKTARETLIKQTLDDSTPNLLKRLSQVPTLKAAVSDATAQGLRDALLRDDMAAFKTLEDAGLEPEKASVEMKKSLATMIARRSDLLGGGKEALDKAEALGIKDEAYEAAVKERLMSVVSAKLNEGRTLEKQIKPGDYDEEAEIEVLKVASKYGKEAHAEDLVKNVDKLGGAEALLARAEKVGLTAEIDQAALKLRDMSLVTAKLNKSRDEGKKIKPGDYDLEADIAIVQAADNDQKKQIAESFIKDQTKLGGAERVLARAENIGIKKELLQAALQTSDMSMVSAQLNEGRATKEKVTPGHNDPEAMAFIAKAKYADVENFKDAHNEVDVDNLSAEEARELVMKGLSYASHRNDQGYTGKASRMTEWRDTLTQIQKKFPNDVGLNHLVGQTDAAFEKLQNNKQSVKTTLSRQFDGNAKVGTGGVGSVAAALGKRSPDKTTAPTKVHHGI